uniref:C-factor n=1 Tax=Caligus clemensi TaxID=344056 RepID=C1C338_CALCM|nr:C-factor [Caligus clemensi]
MATGALRYVLITGYNRGLGLGLAKEVIQKSAGQTKVLATYRNPEESEELLELAQSNPSLVPIQFDVRDYSSYDKFMGPVTQTVGDSGLDLLVNNAGVNLPEGRTLRDLTPEVMLETYKINCISPTLITRDLVPLLSKGKFSPEGQNAVVVQMGAIVGSVSMNPQPGWYPYSCSKSALNMSMSLLQKELKRKKITLISFHPGWVKTDLGGPKAPLTVEHCSKKMLETFLQITPKEQGKFLTMGKKPLTW